MHVQRSDRLVMSQEDRNALVKIVQDGGASLVSDEPCEVPIQPVYTMASHRRSTAGVRQRFLHGLSLSDQLDLGRNDSSDRSKLSRAFVLLPSPTAEKFTILFSGNTSDYFLPAPILTDYDTHILVVRDPSKCFHMTGIPGLGADYAECLFNFRKLANWFNPKQQFCIGVSSGGSGALRFGCDIQADGILGFSVPTTLDLRDDPGAQLRTHPQLHRLYKINRKLGIDLVPYYASRTPRPRVMLAYSSGHLRDKWLAERMGTVDGVELIETDQEAGHRTYRWFRDGGRLNELLNRFFALTPFDQALKQIEAAAHPVNAA